MGKVFDCTVCIFAVIVYIDFIVSGLNAISLLAITYEQSLIFSVLSGDIELNVSSARTQFLLIKVFVTSGSCGSLSKTSLEGTKSASVVYLSLSVSTLTSQPLFCTA